MTIIDKNFTLSNIDFIAGSVILIDKASDWTSFDVVAKVRGIVKHHLQIKKIKVGHAGTLDPMATGLLILCTGKMTKKINQFQELPKRYMGDMLFGATTPSYDGESEIDQVYDTNHIKLDTINSTISNEFSGDIEQVPPMFSAIKIGGQRLYTLARKGKTVERKKRKIHIYDYQIDATHFPKLSFDVTCSKGTYIRSLVHDLGKTLDSGAYMTMLRRMNIGGYDINNALSVDEFEKLVHSLSPPDN